MMQAIENQRPRRATVRSALAVAALALFGASPVLGSTFTVNSTADTTDGTCDAVPEGCTLREAIEAVVAVAGRDTIRFDPAVFTYGENPVRIEMTSALPEIADPAGTVIDGAGASVRLDGNLVYASGLVFSSGARGVPLSKPTVANIAVEGFSDVAVYICGGVPPSCDGDVTGALVRNVVTNTSAFGIVIAGKLNKKARVLDSVAYQSGIDGIRLYASVELIGARVQGSVASRSAREGIALAAESQTGSVIVDSFALRSGKDGIRITADGPIIKPKIGNVVTYHNDTGIRIGGDPLTGASVSNAVASTSTSTGVDLVFTEATAPVLSRVVADANGIHGIDVGSAAAAKISRTRVVGNLESGVVSEVGATDLVLDEIMAVTNGTGVALRGARGTVQRAHANANDGPGILLTEGSGNTVRKSTAFANHPASAGIAVYADSGANVVEDNVALGNGVDLFDESSNCNGNQWSGNFFRTRSEPCIR